MTTTDQRPDPNTVSHEAVAMIAKERAGELYQDVILRDAKIGEQQRYIGHLETRVSELEQKLEQHQDAPTAVAGPRAARQRQTVPATYATDEPAPEPQAG